MRCQARFWLLVGALAGLLCGCQSVQPQDSSPTLAKADALSHDDLAPTLGVAEVPQAQLDGSLLAKPERPCEGLEASLWQIAIAQDGAAVARQMGLTIDQQDRLLVVIVVKDAADEPLADMPEVQVTRRADAQLQAFVPLTELCTIAGLDQVVLVRPPANVVLQ